MLCGPLFFFFFQAEDGIRDYKVTGVQTCALPIWRVRLAAYLGNTLRYDVETTTGLVLKVDVGDPWHHEVLPAGRAQAVPLPPPGPPPLRGHRQGGRAVRGSPAGCHRPPPGPPAPP